MQASTKDTLKIAFCRLLVGFQVHHVFRCINRHRLLVLNYHGVCQDDYDPPIWTQLPRKLFVQQIAYLRKHYNFISMQEFIAALRNGTKLPQRSVLLTFDDGLRNNYHVVFPILKQYEIPATIFLTTDYLDTDSILWFDELFFLLRAAKKHGGKLPIEQLTHCGDIRTTDLWSYYVTAVESLKRMLPRERQIILKQLRSEVDFDINGKIEDFGILSTQQILEMSNSGLVDFGIHTANHRIWGNLPSKEWSEEIREPREKLARLLNREIPSFCYPNGKPDVDFNKNHADFLKKIEYQCAFTTNLGLYDFKKDNPFYIKRIAAGHDITSNLPYFVLNTGGFWSFIKEIFN